MAPKDEDQTTETDGGENQGPMLDMSQAGGQEDDRARPRPSGYITYDELNKRSAVRISSRPSKSKT